GGGVMRAGGSRPLSLPPGGTARPVPQSPARPLPLSSPVDDLRPLLYAVVCGSPPARHVDRLVRLALQAGWQGAVVATPSARAFIDEPALAAQPHYPVGYAFLQTGDPSRPRTADPMVVTPATVNTVRNWASAIADTLALALVVEGQRRGLPLVTMRFTTAVMAAHPAFLGMLGRLRSWGVRVLFGGAGMVLPAPGTG